MNVLPLLLQLVCAAAGANSGADWWVGKGDRNGVPIVVRALAEVPKADVRKSHPWQITITWVRQRTPAGDLSGDDAARAFEFQETLTSLMEDAGLALEAVSVNTDDVAEWTYYADDRDRATAAFKSLKHKFPDASPSIEIHRDVDWRILVDVLEARRK